MLNACGQRTVACGNIGKPLSASHPQSIEVRCSGGRNQLVPTRNDQDFRPQIAVWLNFAPDHLDRYASVAEYRRAKLRIFEYQTEKEFAVVKCERIPATDRAQRLTFSAYDNRGFSFG